MFPVIAPIISNPGASNPLPSISRCSSPMHPTNRKCAPQRARQSRICTAGHNPR
ncbi:Protein of unknown function [Pyronema omphalodes CBS 100304]|uniref:Uncharacterized protein n=1 Tax=Pyronema omphalodes (strain CBS 100304) TaxID=1076935 RepID=U4L7P0_PYROM|nr:Protein of unknown function [Pyronema omphalodes CBS 100304]